MVVGLGAKHGGSNFGAMVSMSTYRHPSAFRHSSLLLFALLIVSFYLVSVSFSIGPAETGKQKHDSYISTDCPRCDTQTCPSCVCKYENSPPVSLEYSDGMKLAYSMFPASLKTLGETLVSPDGARLAIRDAHQITEFNALGHRVLLTSHKNDDSIPRLQDEFGHGIDTYNIGKPLFNSSTGLH